MFVLCLATRLEVSALRVRQLSLATVVGAKAVRRRLRVSVQAGQQESGGAHLKQSVTTVDELAVMMFHLNDVTLSSLSVQRQFLWLVPRPHCFSEHMKEPLQPQFFYYHILQELLRQQHRSSIRNYALATFLVDSTTSGVLSLSLVPLVCRSSSNTIST